MKRILITTVIILCAVGVKAQAGMPKELTCTEEAFNFSFSLGSKWKLNPPKMGPAEFLRYDPEYTPMWRLNIKDVPPQNRLLLKTQQNNAPLFHYPGLSLPNKPYEVMLRLNFNPQIKYTDQKP
jgi:hypothetical protein